MLRSIGVGLEVDNLFKSASYFVALGILFINHYNLHSMNVALLSLYKDIARMPETPEVLEIKRKIVDLLNQDLKNSILQSVSIGDVIGYDYVESYLSKASELIQLYKGVK